MHVHNFKSKATAHVGTVAKIRVYMNDGCWLAVCVYHEGPVTRELDQHFPWVSSALEQTLNCYPKSKLHFILLLKPSEYYFQNFRPKAERQNYQYFATMQPSRNKIQNSAQTFNFFLLLHTTSTSHHLTFFTSQPSTQTQAYLYQKDERAQSGKIHSCNFSLPPPVIYVVPLITALYFFFFFFFSLQRCKELYL